MGDSRDVLLVERLGHQDHFADAFGLNGFIQRSHTVHFHDFQPLPILTKGSRQLGVVPICGQGRRMFWGRILEDEARQMMAQTEGAQVACGRHHIAVEIVLDLMQCIQLQIVLSAVFQQPNLVIVPFLTEQGHGFGDGDLLLRDRRILLHDLPHAALDQHHLLSGERSTIFHLTEEAAQGHGVVNDDTHVREELINGCD